MSDIRTGVSNLLAHLLKDTLVVITVEQLVAGILVLADLVGLETGRLEDDDEAAGVLFLGCRLGHLRRLGDERDVGCGAVHSVMFGL